MGRRRQRFRRAGVLPSPLTARLKDIYPKPQDAEAMKIIFDFGRMPAGAKIVVKDIVFQEFVD